MNNDRSRRKKVAERVVRGVIDDIRIIEIYSYAGITGEEAEKVADLISEARVELKWTK